jgi:hypothetical protein
MRFKRAFLFLLVTSLVQLNARVLPIVFSQADSDATMIEKVIKDFLTALASSDYDVVISQFSENFYSEPDIDYSRIKEKVRSEIDRISKKFVNVSLDEFKVVDSDIQGESAVVSVAHKFKGFNLETSSNSLVKGVLTYGLILENGSWKIVSLSEFSY